MSAEWSLVTPIQAFYVAASLRRVIAVLEGKPGATDALLAPDILFLIEDLGSIRRQSPSRCASDLLLAALSEHERQSLLAVYRSDASAATDAAARPFAGDA